MIEDMVARNLLERAPDTATADDIRGFQLFLIESGASICSRNRVMTGVRFLLRVTLRRHDLAAEVYHRQGANDEQGAQVSVAGLRVRAEALLAAGGVLLRHQPDPGAQVTA